MNVRRIFPYVLFIGLLALAIQPTIDPDMWWHLRTGELIVTSGIPREDVFSFTYPNNEWVTHEWLSQVVMWLIFRAGGFAGLMTFFGVVVTATFWLVYRISDGQPYVAGIVTLVASSATAIVWGSRPQLFNLLLAAVVITLLEGRRRGIYGMRTWVGLVALMVLWVNLHAGYLLGIVIMGTYLIGGLMDARRSSLAGGTIGRRDRGYLAGTIGVSLALTVVNPNGYRMLSYPFETIASPIQREFITEWFPPAPDQPVFWVLLFLIAAGGVALARNRRHLSAIDVLLLLGTASGAFLSVRNIPIFAVIATPVLARHITAALGARTPRRGAAPTTGRLDRPSRIVVGTVAAVAALLVVTTIADNDRAVAEAFPVAAVDLLADLTPQPRVLNAYGWGGYLIWNGLDVFIDGRADVYGDPGLQEFATAYFAEDGWEDILVGRAIDHVLVEPESGLAAALEQTTAWRVVHRSDLAVLFERS